MHTKKLKPELEEKVKQLRSIRKRMIGKREKRKTILPKFWYEFHKSR